MRACRQGAACVRGCDGRRYARSCGKGFLGGFGWNEEDLRESGVFRWEDKVKIVSFFRYVFARRVSGGCKCLEGVTGFR